MALPTNQPTGGGQTPEPPRGTPMPPPVEDDSPFAVGEQAPPGTVPPPAASQYTAAPTHSPAPVTTSPALPPTLPDGRLDLTGLGLNAEALHSAYALIDILASDDSSEVIMNGPNEVLQKIRGQRFHVSEIRFGDAETYHHVLNNVILPFVDTAERIDGENILVEGQMELPSNHSNVPPMLARVHILAPPLVQFAKATIAKKARYDFDIDSIQQTGAMTEGMATFLKGVAHARLTFVASGPTGAGKTTLLQAMTAHFDQNDRVVAIEDTPELRIPLADVVYLCSTSIKPGQRVGDNVTTEWLVKAANRMRMDRVIVGECRGAEMAEWLIAANSGAEGSATTVHADNPRRALDKILGLSTKSQTSGTEATLRREIADTIDIIIQAGLVDGKHVITHIEEVSKTVVQATGLISTTTLVGYNRAKGVHEVLAMPSAELQARMRSRGVPIDMGYFRILN